MPNPNPKPEIQWKPGQSGNPNGRPRKGYSITDTIRNMMETVDKDVKKDLGNMILQKALKGDLKAAELIWAYMDGKPIQTSNILLQESPEEKVKKTLALLKDNVLPSGSSDVLQDQGGKALPNGEGSE